MHDLTDKKLVATANMLIERLGHLSVDSIWAHRASGLRGSIIKYLDEIENRAQLSNTEKETLALLLKTGFDILANAAREIPDTNTKE
jgi:hypothetical protein